MRRAPLLLAAAAAFALAFARPARADEQSDLEKGRAAYLAKNYDDAEQRFQAMLDPKTGTIHDPLLVAEARMYYGATLLAKGHNDQAAAIFEKLILDRPDYEPDPFRLPQEVINFFIDVRARLRERLREQREKEIREKQERERKEREEKAKQQKRLAMLESLASTEVIVEHRSRLVALLPFGAGQFQNDQPALGWTLLVSESLFLATSLVAFPFYRIAVADEANTDPTTNRIAFDQYRNRALTWRAVNLVASGAFVATAIAGIAQAQIAFVPEKTQSRPRAIPPVTLGPMIAPLAGVEGERGAFVGIVGSF